MRSIKKLFTVLTIMLVVGPLSAQYSMHHAGNQMMKSDSTAGRMFGAMRHGGMMSNCPMCGHMMRGGMMGGQNMMDSHSLLKTKTMLINKLPQMRAVLTLTDSQSEKLQQMQNDFQKNQIDKKASLAKKKIDLSSLLDKDTSAPDIRNVMKEMADIKINMAVQAYETARKMKNLLTADQMEKLNTHLSGCAMGGMTGMMR